MFGETRKRRPGLTSSALGSTEAGIVSRYRLLEAGSAKSRAFRDSAAFPHVTKLFFTGPSKINRGSRLPRLVLSDWFFFITCRILQRSRTLEESESASLAQVVREGGAKSAGSYRRRTACDCRLKI